MPRSVNSVASRRRRKKILKAARGYMGARSKVYTVAKNTLDRSMAFAFVGRKLKKRAYRRLWIARINAASRQLGISYSRLIHKFSEAGITLNRRMLAHIAMNQPDAFKSLVDQVNK